MSSVASQTYATLVQLNQVNANANSRLLLTGGILTGDLTMQANINFQNGGDLSMGGGIISNVGTLAINDSFSIASGSSFEFLKGVDQVTQANI